MGLFPYSLVRPEQDFLVQSVNEAIENKKHLIVHAPTGLGKTVAAIVPALEHAISKKLTVFFLTSRHTQHAIAIDTLKKIKENDDTNFIVADLVGKKNMCLQDGVHGLRQGEFHEYCKKLREENKCEYYTNAKNNSKNTPFADVLISNIKKMGALHTEQINEACKEGKMCPYEIATSLAKDSSIIISDYSYIFNTTVRNSLFRRTQKNLNECIVIVDEAHNLPKRIIDSATERLTTFMLRRGIQECNKYDHTDMAVKLTTIMDRLVDQTNGLKQRKKEETLVTRNELIDAINEMQDYDEFIEELITIGESILEKQEQTFLLSIASFFESWKGPDEGFARILSVKDNKLNLLYKCLDPAVISRGVISETYCTIAMSGTLTPTSMYRDLLGFDDCTEKVFKSPFPEENKLSLIVPKTTTKFTARSEEQFKKIAKIVVDITNTVPGNSAVFFPSYSLRDHIYKYLSENTNKTAFLENPEMTKQDKTDMLASFKEYAKTGAVLLGATSGNFSEGIDLMGDLLKCVIIVGLPLQQPDLETQEAIKYYDKKFGKGWDYGYVFPAFNKVLQGAGRCIRSETDRGVIVYLDERYAWPNYIRCFPEDVNLKIKKDYLREIAEFFNK